MNWLTPDMKSVRLRCVLEELNDAERQIVKMIKACRKAPINPADCSITVFRRHGYTAEANPANIVTIMSGGPTISGMFSTKNLVPTRDEIIGQVRKLAEEVTRNPSAAPLNRMMACDDKLLAGSVDRMLRHAGMFCGYYPMASPEEQALLTAHGSSLLQTLPN
jgi:hypothetical protein